MVHNDAGGVFDFLLFRVPVEFDTVAKGVEECLHFWFFRSEKVEIFSDLVYDFLVVDFVERNAAEVVPLPLFPMHTESLQLFF